MEEQELIARVRAGEPAAERALYDAHVDRVYRLSYRIAGDDELARDFTQETFIRAFDRLGTFRGDARFSTWLHAIAMNVAISEYRKRKAMKRDRRTLSLDAPIQGTDNLFVDPAGREVDPGERAHQHEFAGRVRAAVQELPEEFRDAVILRDMQGLSYEEVAEVLGVPAGTVRSRIHRGRLLLQQVLKEFLP